MGSSQRFGNFKRVPNGLTDRETLRTEHRGEALAIEAFHDEKLDVVGAPNVVNRADAMMIQAREQLRFPVEPAAVIRTNGVVRAKNLDGYDPVQELISGFIDFAHTSFAQALDEFVSSKSNTDR